MVTGSTAGDAGVQYSPDSGRSEVCRCGPKGPAASSHLLEASCFRFPSLINTVIRSVSYLYFSQDRRGNAEVTTNPPSHSGVTQWRIFYTRKADQSDGSQGGLSSTQDLGCFQPGLFRLSRLGLAPGTVEDLRRWSLLRRGRQEDHTQPKPLGPSSLQAGGPAKPAPAAPATRPSEEGRPVQSSLRAVNRMASGLGSISPGRWGRANINYVLNSTATEHMQRARRRWARRAYQFANLRRKSRKWSLLSSPHFTVEETEVPDRDEVTCPRWHGL